MERMLLLSWVPFMYCFQQLSFLLCCYYSFLFISYLNIFTSFESHQSLIFFSYLQRRGVQSWTRRKKKCYLFQSVRTVQGTDSSGMSIGDYSSCKYRRIILQAVHLHDPYSLFLKLDILLQFCVCEQTSVVNSS